MIITDRIYVVNWPDGTISFLTAKNDVDLYDKLDVECSCPEEGDLKIHEIKPDEFGQFHLITKLEEEIGGSKDGQIKVRVDITGEIEDKLVPFKFKKDIAAKWLKKIKSK